MWFVVLFFVVWCVLIVVRCSFFVVCCLLFDVCCPFLSFVGCSSLFVVCHCSSLLLVAV